jgi:formylglycine-generating enzyme required for sulfatase activity
LLIFGDGSGFFDPFSGAPQRWVEQFGQWPERALITPVEPGPECAPQWGYREAELQQSGFVVLPANSDGFELLTAWLNAGLMRAPRATAARPFPTMVADRPKRWVERIAPVPKLVTRLLDDLQRYLDEPGWLWLRACAVYPQVTWELTLYLGARLLERTDKVAWGERLLQLVRLPWFRYGTMPDWVRAELLARLDPAEEARVRGVIADLLQHLLTKPDEAIPLEIATAPEAETHWRQRWRARLQRWWQLRKLFWAAQRSAPESPLRDYVFLNFLAGRRPQRLDVQAPALWRRLFLVEGQWALGFQPLTLGVLAVLAAAVLFVMFYLQPILRTPEPAPIGAPPFARPTVDPRVSLTPAPRPSPTATRTPPPSPSAGGTGVDQGPGRQDTVPPDLGVKGAWPVIPIAGGYRVEMGKGVALELVALPGGDFMMGSDKSEYADERPAHQVRVSPFAMGKFEVTQAQWLAVMGGKNPSNFSGADRPVEQVSWDEAVRFCQRLSQLTGAQFRLPTEAEWEYAARAGTTTEYSFGDDDKQLGAYAWFGNNSGNQTHPVGQKLPNSFGLYDMHGNVWEWCQDWYDENYYAQLQKQQGVVSNPRGPSNRQFRVLRGGSWVFYSNSCRSALRNYYDPGDRYNFIGFRVVVSARN